MTGRKNRALQVPPVVPYKALENFSKALYGTTRGTCTARFFRPVMVKMLNLTAIVCHLGGPFSVVFPKNKTIKYSHVTQFIRVYWC